MGGCEQRDNRLAREVRCHELENQIERGRVRLCGQRQRVEGLIWNAGIRKHVASEVHIRQGAFEHHGPAIEIGRTRRLYGRCDRRQLVFPVTAHGKRLRVRRRNENRASGVIDHIVRVVRQLAFFEAGHELLETIQQTRRDCRVRGDDVDLFEERQLCQKSEIGRPETC